jgi:hypothetical protein
MTLSSFPKDERRKIAPKQLGSYVGKPFFAVGNYSLCADGTHRVLTDTVHWLLTSFSSHMRNSIGKYLWYEIIGFRAKYANNLLS